MGRHFVITNKDDKNRLYTSCQTLSDNVEEYRQNLIQEVDQRLNNPDHKPKSVECPDFALSLTFVMKKYDNKLALSKQITESEKGEQFNIQGPVVSVKMIALI